MALAPIVSVLLAAVITRCKSEATFGYHTTDEAQFGALLKPPPPPPPLSKIQPVPFHGGAPGRIHRQNLDLGYHYAPPPPPPPPPSPTTSNEFKFPAPFYKQYNFNFLPQPFTTTPSPSLFQKVSGWLFPSQQTSFDSGISSLSSNVSPVKKDCNPCNMVPWIPVIRYDLEAKNEIQNIQPTYGSPSPTAYANALQYQPKPFNLQNNENLLPSVSSGKPFEIYGPPKASLSGNSFNSPSSTYGPPSATLSSNYVAPSQNYGQSGSFSHGPLNPTYGPPSPTHTIAFNTGKPPSSTNSAQSSTFGVSSSSIKIPSSTYNAPSSSLGDFSSSYPYSSSSFGTLSSTYSPPFLSYGPPSQPFENSRPASSTHESQSLGYFSTILNNDLSQQSEADLTNNVELSTNIQLPKVSKPKEFRNSYGEPITNPSAYGIPYPVSATGAESNKVKTEILPNDPTKPLSTNVSFALANPAPFSMNRGRNIHTLQPVALPNLSVSPLPPIFNARPFRPIKAAEYASHFVHGINQMQQTSNNVKVSQSVPIAEFTQSIDYPASIIQSPIIDIDSSKISNQSKAFRNIPNSYIVDEYRDISSQASEDHISATKSSPDASFESTGADAGNNLDSGYPNFLKHKGKIPSNHKSSFADLRGVKDDDVDKYRTESNLQNIDSPLLYLKPSAPHKDYENFVLALPTPSTNKDYEIYDDSPTTEISQYSTPPSAWDESRTDYNEEILPPPIAQEDSNRSKIIQIIIPYTSNQQENDKQNEYENESPEWIRSTEGDFQPRKIPANTDIVFDSNTVTDNYNPVTTTTDLPSQSYTEHYDDRYNTPSILNDLYDVKEPPFDIIKLQNNIDDWTEQEYSKGLKNSQKSRNNEKYAKQIPDDYFTTESSFSNYVTPTSNYNYDFYDHEGSSSIYHAITETRNKTVTKPRKEYNSIDRGKNKKFKSSGKGRGESIEELKPYIYTAASSFRSSSTTLAPWSKILTSISPLTKEKVYVVTSKPWSERQNVSKEWYNVESFESKKTNVDNDVSASDNVSFKVPRFYSRPTLQEEYKPNSDSVDQKSSYGFSRNWHQRINELEPTTTQNNKAFLPEGSHSKISNTMDEHTTTVEPLRKDGNAR